MERIYFFKCKNSSKKELGRRVWVLFLIVVVRHLMYEGVVAALKNSQAVVYTNQEYIFKRFKGS